MVATSKCLDDEILRLIAHGKISSPTLEHYLEHLHHCLECCTRCDTLGRDKPTPLLRMLALVPDGLKMREKGAGPHEVRPPAGIVSPEMDDCLPRPTPDSPVEFAGLSLVEKLGEGSAAVVYRAIDHDLERQVAVKILRRSVPDNKKKDETFLAEARALARVNHPNLLTVHGYGREPLPYIEMELLAGNTLGSLAKQRPLPEWQALAIIAGLAEALEALQQHHIVHRDISPANVWIKPGANPDSAPVPVLMDFGLVAHRNTRAGTPGFMAPEVLSGKAAPSGASDMFALGALLRWMLTDGGKASPLGVKPIANARLARIIDEMMAPDLAERPSPGLLRSRLAGLRRPSLSRRNLVAGAGIVTLLGVAAWFATRRGQKGEQSGGIAPVARWANPFTRFRPGEVNGLIPNAGGVWAISGGSMAFLPSGGTEASAPVAPDSAGRRFISCISGEIACLENTLGNLSVVDFSGSEKRVIGNYDGGRLFNYQMYQSVALGRGHPPKVVLMTQDSLYSLAWPTGRGANEPELTLISPTGELFSKNRVKAIGWGNGERELLGHMANGGLELVDLDRQRERIWAFKPHGQEEKKVIFLDEDPGAFLLASTSGYFSRWGPMVDPGPAPFPVVMGQRKFDHSIHDFWKTTHPGKVLVQTGFSPGNLVVLEAEAPFEQVGSLDLHTDFVKVGPGARLGDFVVLFRDGSLARYSV